MIRRRFLLSVTLLLSARYALPAQDTWTGVDRVVAIGDVHGDFERFTAVLRSASLIEYATDEHRELSVAV